MFVNSEVVLSILQMVEIQVKVYEEFKKRFDEKEARIQAEIFMRSLLGTGEDDGKGRD